MFCLESKDLIIVELYLLHTVTQKFDRVTITRLSKMPSNWGLLFWGFKLLSEFSSRVQHPLFEMQAFFKYVQLDKEVTLDVSPYVSVLKIFSSRRGDSNSVGIGINLPSVGIVLSFQWGQNKGSSVLKRCVHWTYTLALVIKSSNTIVQPLSPSYSGCTQPREVFWFVSTVFLEYYWWLLGCKCFSLHKPVAYLI